MSHSNRRLTIVYRRIEFVTWILSIVTWNLSHGYRLSPHRICHLDIVYRHIIIVYCHIVIVYHRIDVVTCSSSHTATFRATVFIYCAIVSPFILRSFSFSEKVRNRKSDVNKFNSFYLRITSHKWPNAHEYDYQ